MPLPSYPSTIPYRARRNDWSMVQPFAPPLETEMEDGSNVRLRSKPGANVAIVQQIVRMLPTDWATFDGFVRATLNNGTSRFTMSVWLGSSYQTKTVQFVKGSPTYQNLDRFVQVAMKLRVFGM
jgi:hypothetical protein